MPPSNAVSPIPDMNCARHSPATCQGAAIQPNSMTMPHIGQASVAGNRHRATASTATEESRQPALNETAA